MILIASNASVAMMAAAIAILTWILLRRWSRYFKKRSRPGKVSALEKQPRPEQEKYGNIHSVPAEMMKWEVEFHEKAREISARIDTKMVALQQLLLQSEEQLARLEAVLKRFESIDPALLAAGSRHVSPEDSPVKGAASQADDDATVDDEAASEVLIFRLAEEGFSAATIAHRSRRPLSEVEAILATRSS